MKKQVTSKIISTSVRKTCKDAIEHAPEIVEPLVQKIIIISLENKS